MMMMNAKMEEAGEKLLVSDTVLGLPFFQLACFALYWLSRASETKM